MLTRRTVLACAAALPALSLPAVADNPYGRLRALRKALRGIPLSPRHDGWRKHIFWGIEWVVHRLPDTHEACTCYNAICGFSQLLQLESEPGSPVHAIAGEISKAGWAMYEARRTV